MMIELLNIPVSLDAMLPGNEGLLDKELAKATGLPKSILETGIVTRKSVDARRRSNVHFVISYAVHIGEDGSDQREVERIRSLLPKRISARPYAPPGRIEAPDLSAIAEKPGFKRPIVVGAGPAGLFCGLYLARAGLRPIIIERGKPVDLRKEAVDRFFSEGILDPECNVQFGEGGAGTFSDGKLTTGTKSPHIRGILREFVEAGAPEDILVDSKPHIGTDRLGDVVRNIRRSIEESGGEFLFETRLDDIEIRDGCVCAVKVSFPGAKKEKDACARISEGTHPIAADLGNGRHDPSAREEERLDCSALILAIGHSARDTYGMLIERGFEMVRKPFAMGVRIEHLQEDVDRAMYGRFAGHPALGAADYKLAVHNADGRGVYTFCMCPGGTVVAASSEDDAVCVNGMSEYARDGRNANSALLVEIRPDDFEGDDPLAGMHMQRRLERAAFHAANGSGAGMGADARDSLSNSPDSAGSEGAVQNRLDYKAPAERVGDFLSASESPRPSAEVCPTYPRGVEWVDLRTFLPAFMVESMEEAMPVLDRKLAGFSDPEAVMTAVEARSSAPVKMIRGTDSLQSSEFAGVFPCGEGAGYAGGIMSAAADGLRCAEKASEYLSSLPDPRGPSAPRTPSGQSARPGQGSSNHRRR